MLKNNNTENVALGRVQGERAQWGKTTKGMSIILATRKVFFEKKKRQCCFAEITAGFYINPPCNNSGDFIPWCVSFKEIKEPFCLCVYYLICFCSLFVPELKLRQGKWWLSDPDSQEPLFYVHWTVSKDGLSWMVTTSQSLGPMGAPGLIFSLVCLTFT